jgi:hypothetical protein
MIDPLTALSIATTAVGQIRELISAGQDCEQRDWQICRGLLGRSRGASPRGQSAVV